tara:strand:- start:39071 stop:42208 length:3138 start_codon:yes stop_codon:yes gene_type:complete
MRFYTQVECLIKFGKDYHKHSGVQIIQNCYGHNVPSNMVNILRNVGCWTDEPIPVYRVKTEEELTKEFGDKWREKKFRYGNNYTSWKSGMDELFNKVLTETELLTLYGEGRLHIELPYYDWYKTIVPEWVTTEPFHEIYKPQFNSHGGYDITVQFMDKFYDSAFHLFHVDDRKYYENCPTKHHNCPVCEKNSVLWTEGNDEDTEFVRRASKKYRYYAPVKIIQDKNNPKNDGTFVVYRFGKKVFDSLPKDGNKIIGTPLLINKNYVCNVRVNVHSGEEIYPCRQKDEIIQYYNSVVGNIEYKSYSDLSKEYDRVLNNDGHIIREIEKRKDGGDVGKYDDIIREASKIYEKDTNTKYRLKTEEEMVETLGDDWRIDAYPSSANGWELDWDCDLDEHLGKPISEIDGANLQGSDDYSIDMDRYHFSRDWLVDIKDDDDDFFALLEKGIDKAIGKPKLILDSDKLYRLKTEEELTKEFGRFRKKRYATPSEDGFLKWDEDLDEHLGQPLSDIGGDGEIDNIYDEWIDTITCNIHQDWLVEIDGYGKDVVEEKAKVTPKKNLRFITEEESRGHVAGEDMHRLEVFFGKELTESQRDRYNDGKKFVGIHTVLKREWVTDKPLPKEVPQYRIKTEQEFINAYGEKWRNRSFGEDREYCWVKMMDKHFGKILDYNQCKDIVDKGKMVFPVGAVITEDMCCELIGNVDETKEFKQEYTCQFVPDLKQDVIDEMVKRIIEREGTSYIDKQYFLKYCKENQREFDYLCKEYNLHRDGLANKVNGLFCNITRKLNQVKEIIGIKQYYTNGVLDECKGYIREIDYLCKKYGISEKTLTSKLQVLHIKMRGNQHLSGMDVLNDIEDKKFLGKLKKDPSVVLGKFVTDDEKLDDLTIKQSEEPMENKTPTTEKKTPMDVLRTIWNKNAEKNAEAFKYAGKVKVGDIANEYFANLLLSKVDMPKWVGWIGGKKILKPLVKLFIANTGIFAVGFMGEYGYKSAKAEFVADAMVEAGHHDLMDIISLDDISGAVNKVIDTIPDKLLKESGFEEKDDEKKKED